MANKPGKKKPKKLSNVGTTKRKEILVWKTEQEIFEVTKLVIETQHGAKGLAVDQTAKPNQTSLALSLRFHSPSHHQQMFTKGRFFLHGNLLTPKYQDMIQK